MNNLILKFNKFYIFNANLRVLGRIYKGIVCVNRGDSEFANLQMAETLHPKGLLDPYHIDSYHLPLLRRRDA